jgi:hypothetical protein
MSAFPVGLCDTGDQRSFGAGHFIFRVSNVRIQLKVSVGGPSGGTVEIEKLRHLGVFIPTSESGEGKLPRYRPMVGAALS